MTITPMEIQAHTTVSELVKAYRWADIEKAVCEKMALSVSRFQDIKNEQLDPYNNFWLVCRETVLLDEVENGGLCTLYGGAQGLDFEGFKANSPTWSHPYLDALESVFTQLDPNTDGFVVHFEW